MVCEKKQNEDMEEPKNIFISIAEIDKYKDNITQQYEISTKEQLQEMFFERNTRSSKDYIELLAEIETNVILVADLSSGDTVYFRSPDYRVFVVAEYQEIPKKQKKQKKIKKQEVIVETDNIDNWL